MQGCTAALLCAPSAVLSNHGTPSALQGFVCLHHKPIATHSMTHVGMVDTLTAASVLVMAIMVLQGLFLSMIQADIFARQRRKTCQLHIVLDPS